ncbi:Retrovirus-related Pol polyprotein from transposon TNT 1-94 [Dendrobium catenatum]|uniref:Retrovirus-related Pol polyprotein from transposon TNT 1-94 n=1 Tax=Dendrobium catenatum TaxID=906689 RepID=A0A2I0VNG8_9ASPA|nr:Retrovirus-related Pol polyprotein from transposon TNT 1-94 [Dendrobium catenatum]
MTADSTNLQHSNAYHGPDSVSTANGSSIPIQNFGQGLLPLPNSPRKLHLCHLLHVPTLTHNLLSVSKLTQENNVTITFDSNGFDIKDVQTQQPLLRGRLLNGIYQLHITPDAHPKALHTTNSSSTVWHARLGHPNNKIFNTLVSRISNMQHIPSDFQCQACSMAKSHKQTFKNRQSVTTHPFELIHSDVWGPIPTSCSNNFRYYVVFIDDFTKFSWIYFMRTKNETFSCFKNLLSMIYNQFNKTPKTLRSDSGGEFLGNEFTNYLNSLGIHHQLSCPHTPEQNGVAERKHRHLLDITRTLLIASGLPNSFWTDALSTANYLINRLPSKTIALQTPFQKLYNNPPDYDNLRTFGCLCYPWLQPYAKDKLSPRSQPCLFLGYSTNHKGYKCFNIATNKTQISRHVVFHEPTTYNQASKHLHWQQAMTNEYQALIKQHTWSLVPAPPNKQVIGCKWTYKTKTLPSGQIDRYKARLVALGYTQNFGEHYNETFSPVAKMVTIRMLLILAVNRNWPMLQLDVSNAFLHGDLSEDIYMRQPPGFEDPLHPTAVCKLHKSLYGLKQAPRQWFQKFTSFLQSRGFRFSRSDPSLLIYNKSNVHIFLLIYVDDILVTGNDPAQIQSLLQDLHSNFALKQLGQISLFLGIQVTRTTNGFFLNQGHYAQKIIQDAGLTDCKAAPTPITPSSKNPPADSPPFRDAYLYRRLAGSLQYLSITRPDIAFATNQACQHMQHPTDHDFQNIKRILRYVKGTYTYGLQLYPATSTFAPSPTQTGLPITAIGNLSQDFAPSWDPIFSPGP